MLFIKLVYKEIRSNFRISLLLVFNLALGLSGLAAINSLKVSITEALHLRAKGILAADLSVGGRRALSQEEITKLNQILPPDSVQTQTFESFTMVSTPTNSRLVELKAVEANYPFYGEIELTKGGLITGSSQKDLFMGQNAWAYSELLTQLGLSQNDEIQIGSLKFTISDLVLRDSAGVGSGFSFAPPIYLSLENFKKTDLLKVGSTGYFTTLIKIKNATEDKLDKLVFEINNQLTDPAIRVQTSRNASEQVGRLLSYLSDYLGLAGLVALFLTALGQIFLYRSYITKRRQDIAILKTLGLSQTRIFWLYLLHIAILSLLALVPALIFTSILLPALSHPLAGLIGLEFQVTIHFLTFALLLCVSLTVSFFVCGPMLLNTLNVHPRELLNPPEVQNNKPKKQLIKTILYYTPAFVTYFILSLWLAKSYVTGSIFYFIFMGTLVSLYIIGLLILYFIEKFKFKNMIARLSMRNLVRARQSTLAALVTLSLGVCLANLIPNLESGIHSEIKAPRDIDQPSLFLFDIQSEQLSGLLTLLTENKVNIMQSSPMIRSRLTLINNEPFEKRTVTGNEITREQENENRFRNRGFNLTYRHSLSSSEKIVQGVTFEDWQNSTPPISIEINFAKRLDLKIGDQLTFDIQGVLVTGQIINFRKVRWTSFQPNFFIQFDDNGENILKDAPQTHLVTTGPLSAADKLSLQTNVVKNFANVSIVDVSRIVDRLSDIIRQMSFALKVMAFFSVLIGLIILFSVVSHQMFERRREVNLLKILGAEFFVIKKIFILEFMLISACAVFLGTLLSFLISRFLSIELFDSAFVLNVYEPLVIGFSLILICLFIVLFVTGKVLKSKPALEARK